MRGLDPSQLVSQNNDMRRSQNGRRMRCTALPMIVIAENRIDAERRRQRPQGPGDSLDRNLTAAEITASQIVAREQYEIRLRRICQFNDATNLRLVDEARTGVQIGDDRDAESAEAGAISAIDRQRMVDDGEARRLDPKGIDAKRKDEASKERKQDCSAAADQNLIRARESSDTALVPVWPPKFI
jgi:hypothetical protein